jgi:myo-inositol-1(or 4)-monophosphatase
MLTFRPTWEWDVAAGALIVEEARGLCTDRRGGPVRFNNPHPQLDGLIAAGPALHDALMRALGHATKDPGAA